MFQVNEESTHREIVLFISSLPRHEIIAIGVFLNNNCDADIPFHGSKSKIIRSIMEIEKEDLLDAVEVILGTDEEEDEEHESDSDEDCEPDDDDENEEE